MSVDFENGGNDRNAPRAWAKPIWGVFGSLPVRPVTLFLLELKSESSYTQFTLDADVM